MASNGDVERAVPLSLSWSHRLSEKVGSSKHRSCLTEQEQTLVTLQRVTITQFVLTRDPLQEVPARLNVDADQTTMDTTTSASEPNLKPDAV